MNLSLLDYCPLVDSKHAICSIWDQPYDNLDPPLGNPNAGLKPLPLPCHKMALLENPTYPEVILMNSTQLLMHLGNQTSGICTLVLFYAVWCPFSMQMAPAYNALGRLFPTVPIVAVNIDLQYNIFATNQLKFGTTAVPNLLIFDGLRSISRYNKSQLDLPSLVSFVNQNFRLSNNFSNEHCPDTEESDSNEMCISSFTIQEKDYEGPVPVEFQKSPDWLLYVAILVLLLLVYDRYKR
uniref:Thioredoxin domain-containing protein 15-like n=1 Tax=Phallusia mammillata TaxID=59560 RepID=A0A6F9DWJ6_9ASCI|nr:thioredoxin domain-containing protein 15-like [Phallusia mammillata]